MTDVPVTNRAAKRLVVVSGTMGIGKSATCAALLDRLQPGAWLDGDWCCMMKPVAPDAADKAMVEDNIVHMLDSYLGNPRLHNVVFCWVMHDPAIRERLIGRLASRSMGVHRITLTCSPAVLERRFAPEIAAGRRTTSDLERSLARLPGFGEIGGFRLDVGQLDASHVADRIVAHIGAA